MSDKPVKTDALSWSGGARRVPPGEANKGAVEGFTLGVAEARTSPSADHTVERPRGKSAFAERPAVEVKRIEDEATSAVRANGRVKLDRY